MPSRAVLPPIPQFAQRANLLRAAVTPPAEGDQRWQNGGAWQPEPCSGGTSYDPCTAATLTLADQTGATGTDAYAISVGDRCSALAIDAEELRSRALRQMAAQESHLVEAALWTGQTEQGTPDIQGIVQDAADPLGGVAVGLVSGLGILYREIAETAGGARAMIHAPVQLAPFLAFYGAAVRVGDVNLAGLLDHQIVIGTGYTGSGPDDAAPDDGVLWIYATSWVEVRLGPVQVIPGGLAEAVDRTSNTIEYRAERAALHRFDPCLKIGVPVCIPDPGPDCA